MAKLTDFTVEVALAAGSTPKTASPSYTNRSSFVRASAGVSLSRGRSNEFDAQAQPGRASWEFTNTDGRFTVGNASSPYAPVQLRWPCRVRVTYGATTYPLWQGFIDSFGNSREETSGVARIEASDRLARAGVKLPAALTADLLYDSPTYLFTLGDAFGTSTAGDVTATSVRPLSVAQVGSGGSLDFGSGEAPGPDEGTVVAFTRSNATNGKRLLSTGQCNLNGGITGTTLEAMVRPSSTSQQMSAVRAFYSSDTFVYCDLGVSSTGKARAVVSGGSTSVTLVGTTTLSTTSANHIAVTQSAPVADVVTVRLYVNGVQEDSDTYSRDLTLAFTSLSVGGYSGGDMWDGQISHVAGYIDDLSSTRLLSHADGRNGWTGESSVDRFGRLCAYAGLPATAFASVGTASATMAPQSTLGRPLLELLREVAEAELSVVYVDSAGVLTLGTREVRYDAPVALTLDASKPGQVGPDFSAETDDSLLVNDYTVSRPEGATQRVADEASIAAYDTQAETATLYVDDDDQAETAAEWRVYTSSQPQPRTSTLTIDAVAFVNSGGTVANLLGVEIGDRVQVTNLPVDVSASATLDLFVEGVAWRIDKDRITCTLTTSPLGASGSVFIFDDATYGRFDTGGVFAA